MTLLLLLSHTGLFLLSVNVILYFTGFAKHGKAYKIFSLYLLAICVIQIVMVWLAGKNQNNHFLSGYYLFLQLLLLGSFFQALFKPIHKTKSNIILYSLLFTVACLAIQYILDPGLYFVFNSIGFLATSIILVIYSVLYLYEHLSRKLPFLYVTAGIFIYLVSSSIIFASASAVVTFSADTYNMVWNINAMLFILYQLLILWEWKKAFLPKAAI